MKNLSILLAFILCAWCKSTTVDWQFHQGFSLDSNERSDLLNLAGTLGFNNIYEVEVGIFGKYDSSKAAVAKQVILVNDTLQQESWLYLWKRKWTNSQLFRKFGDSSNVNKLFITGRKSVKKVNKYIYHHLNERKMFMFMAGSGSYDDVRVILNCILNDSAIEDSMQFKEETKQAWAILKKNIIDFKSVMDWGNYYSFEYYIPDFKMPGFEHSEFVLKVKRVGNGCQILYAGPRGPGI